MKKIITLTICMLLAFLAFSQNIQGSWRGTLNAGSAKLPITLNISQKDGLYSATMDSPNQGAKGIPITAITFENEKLSFSIANLRAEYTEQMQGDSIVGTFKQSNMALPLNLSKTGTNSALPTKLQDIKPPYLHYSEDMKFENKKANVTLSGTLTWPKEGKDFPVAVLVTGSGPQNRDEEVLGIGLFWYCRII